MRAVIKKGIVSVCASVILVVGVYPKVSADDAIVPIIPIAEGILAYILAAATGASYITTNEGDAGNFGNVTNYDEEVRTLALGWATVAGLQIKQAAYDAWKSAYEAGTKIQIPEIVRNWIADTSKVEKFLATSAIQTFMDDSGWQLAPMSYDDRRAYFGFSPEAGKLFKFEYLGNVYYANAIETWFGWYHGSMYLWYRDYIGSQTMVELPVYDIWPYNPENDKDYLNITIDLALLWSVELFDKISQIDKAEFDKIHAKETVYVGNLPVTVPTPKPKDIVIQGEGDAAKPVGFPIPNQKTIKDTTTGLDKDVITVPIDGVDTDVITGEGVGAANPPIDFPIEGILEGIEGIISKIGDIAISIGNWFDLTRPIDWSPMRAIPAPLTRTFPFSLPWDIGRMVDELTRNPVPPDFEATMLINGKTYKQRIEVISWFAEFAPIVRSGVVILFTLGMIFAVSRLFGGAK